MKRPGVDDGPFTNPGYRCRALKSAVTPERFMTQLRAAEDGIIIPTLTRQCFVKAVDLKLFGANK
jgi:hypothetical protein